MAIAHINHVRQSTLTEYILQNFKYIVVNAAKPAENNAYIHHALVLLSILPPDLLVKISSVI